MIDKILKDIKGLFKVQDKTKFLKQNIHHRRFTGRKPRLTDNS